VEETTVRVSDTANIFHGTKFIVRTHDVVYFREGVSLAKTLLVKVNCRLSDSKDHICTHEFIHGPADVHSLRSVHRIIILVNIIVASADRIQVARDTRRLLKLIDSKLCFFEKFRQLFNVVALQNTLNILLGFMSYLF